MLEAIGLSDTGCVRSNNEDYYLVAPTLGLYVVADGMGGAQAGEHASKLAAETVCEVVTNSRPAGAETLLKAFEEANRRVLQAAASDSQLEGMGTTLVAALEFGDEVQIASVGDSRAYVYDGSRLIVITEDQTWVHEVGRRLGLDEENLKTHPMRHVLTMAIGVSPQIRIHTYALKPTPGTQLLLCSDGLHGVLDETTIARILASGSDLQEKCRVLVETARSAGGPDNITTVLLTARNGNG
jgi:PPM family protein phosphatase